ncbi:beta-1,4-galactosyltransferase 4-like [Paramacrobiotus metropolitanus]|uniref:beta-1,4-galactosyltransferase 4-like n=1 Tax=Paramacrobiotus metropolitanus TaxID=2943436 RepID=UPI002445B4BB|nr:beta-1,4-galactosyltransferase 4-like [Paramacrobiotus metropolitanus]
MFRETCLPLAIRIIRTIIICALFFSGTYLLITLSPPGKNNAEFIASESNIFQQLVKPDNDRIKFFDTVPSISSDGKILCATFPPTLIGWQNMAPLIFPAPEGHISFMNPRVRSGGQCKPEDCQAKQKVAIIVPYRNRTDHLFIFLRNIHPFLQRQQQDYRIFVVEQSGQLPFNRGKLLNAGFVEACKPSAFDCVVFHDIDSLPENDHNFYTCTQQPTLLAVAVSKENYKLKHWNFFSTAISIKQEQFSAVNGYPNLYWGWGSEDDDLSERVRHRYGRILRRPKDIGRYTSVQHNADTLNPKNALNYHMAKSALLRAGEDGLNSLRYRVLRKEERPLYTWILVDIGQPPRLVRVDENILGYLKE